MITNIQNLSKPPNDTHKDCKKPCCSSSLDNNTVSVEYKVDTAYGIPSKTIKKRLKNRKDLLQIKNIGKKLLTHNEILTKKNTRHTYCGYSAKTETDFVSIQSNLKPNHENQLEKNNFISGTAQCKEIWRCPSCSMKLLKGRTKEVYKLLKAHQKNGYALGFVTYTVQHNQENSLKETLDKVLNNYRKFQSHKYFRTLKSYPLLGQVKSLEITHTIKNGWHPHLHVIYFYKTNNTEFVKNAQKELIQDWANYTGGSVNAQNQQVVFTQKDLVEYITKWDAVQELTNDFNKTSKGIKPFELLSIIAQERHIFKTQKINGKIKKIGLSKSIQIIKSLWLEYVETTRGKRRITTSRKLNQLYNIKEKTDEQILSETEEATKIVSFSHESWKTIYKYKLQPHLLYICDIHPNIKTQQKEIIKYLSKIDSFYLDNREWDILNLSDEPIIRKTSEKEDIFKIDHFSIN